MLRRVDNQMSWVSNTNPFGLAAPFGTHFLDMTGSQDNGSFSGVTQTMATPPLQAYTLSVALGANQDVGSFAGSTQVSVTAGGASASFTFAPSGMSEP